MNLECPVCHEGFDNEQGKGGHIASLKDASHEAYRSLGTLPSPSPGVQPSLSPGQGPSEDTGRASAPSGSQGQDPARKAEGSAYPQPSPPGTAEAGSALKAQPLQQGSEGLGDVELVAFEPPAQIEPLKANPGQGAGQGASILGEGAPRVTVPFEPIIAGTTALSLNAFFLSTEDDEEIAVQDVRALGFSRAADACIKLYFPEVGTDHPVVALLASSIGLAMLVMSKKGKKKRDREAQAAPSTPSVEPSPPSPQPSREPSRPSPAPSTPSTGDAYWDSILRNAGGVRLGD